MKAREEAKSKNMLTDSALELGRWCVSVCVYSWMSLSVFTPLFQDAPVLCLYLISFSHFTKQFLVKLMSPSLAF